MYIQSIKIQNFRNYETLSLSFNKGINIIYGKNAQGKTNLLESIYVLGITKSHRLTIDNHLIKNNEKFLNIKGIIKKTRFPTELELSLSQEKELKIDNRKINKVSDYISLMNIIIFYPEDLEIVKGSPSVRRRFLNLELSQLYNGYYMLLNDYNKLLKMRNDYLKKMKNGQEIDENYMNILNEYFVEKGSSIYKLRKKFIFLLNEKCGQIYKNITGLDSFHIVYESNIDNSSDDKQEIKNNFKNKLNSMILSELKFKASLVGPHRDDISFYLNDQNLKLYGSQGQQRIAVLAMKLAEIDIFKTYTNTTPILLLDDIFSELDNRKKNNLLRYIKNNIQTIITTTELSSINKKIIDKAKLIEIEDGKIKKIKEVKENAK
jgi:DNA replication and repair protein RecF